MREREREREGEGESRGGNERWVHWDCQITLLQLENFGTRKTCTRATRNLRTHSSNCGRDPFEQL
jgi:hypothetical protein